MAPGTVNGNFPFSSGHSHLLPAGRTLKIAVGAVFPAASAPAQDPVFQGQKLFIFLPALCMISGKHPYVSPHQQRQGNGVQDHAAEEKRQNNQRQSGKQKKTAQLIHPVAPLHKILQLISESVHIFPDLSG